jgi:hypothetical protein
MASTYSIYSRITMSTSKNTGVGLVHNVRHNLSSFNTRKHTIIGTNYLIWENVQLERPSQTIKR